MRWSLTCHGRYWRSDCCILRFSGLASLSVWTAITNYHRLWGFKGTHLFYNPVVWDIHSPGAGRLRVMRPCFLCSCIWSRGSSILNYSTLTKLLCVCSNFFRILKIVLCYVSFCYTTSWISCRYTYISPVLSLPSCPIPHPVPLEYHRHWAELAVLYVQLPSSLYFCRWCV